MGAGHASLRRIAVRRPNLAMFAAAKENRDRGACRARVRPVGHATITIADYVLPYWASSLDKQVQIGAISSIG